MKGAARGRRSRIRARGGSSFPITAVMLSVPWKAAEAGTVVGRPHAFTVVPAPVTPESAALAQLHRWSRRQGV